MYPFLPFFNSNNALNLEKMNEVTYLMTKTGAKVKHTLPEIQTKCLDPPRY